MRTYTTTMGPAPSREEVVRDLANAMLYMAHEQVVDLVAGIVLANAHDVGAMHRALDVALEAHETAVLQRLEPPVITLSRED